MKRYGSNVLLGTGLSYLDRAAALLCPLLVLKVMGRADAYVSIEYVLSVSIILATFFDAGLRNYLLFDARERHSEAAALSSAAKAFKPLLLLHILCLLFVLAAGRQGEDDAHLIALAIARASALATMRLVMQGMILVGRPALAPLVSITSWGLSCVVLAWPNTASDTVLVTVFFGGSFAMLIGAVGLAVWPLHAGPNIKSIVEHLGRSLKWGWPLLLSAAGAMIVSNYSKVYAFSNLPDHDVLAFIFWMRAYSILQLSHSAVVSVLMRQIYRAEHSGIVLSNVVQYFRYIAPTAVLIGAASLFGGVLVSSIPFLSLAAAAVMFIYFFVWCFGAYLEVYLSRGGKNSVILKASLVSSALYIIGVAVGKPVDAVHLSVVMAASAVVYTGIMVWALRGVK